MDNWKEIKERTDWNSLRKQKEQLNWIVEDLRHATRYGGKESKIRFASAEHIKELFDAITAIQSWMDDIQDRAEEELGVGLTKKEVCPECKSETFNVEADGKDYNLICAKCGFTFWGDLSMNDAPDRLRCKQGIMMTCGKNWCCIHCPGQEECYSEWQRSPDNPAKSGIIVGGCNNGDCPNLKAALCSGKVWNPLAALAMGINDEKINKK